MKFLIETGNESHSTSSAKVQAKFAGGQFDGQHLYQQKQFQVSAKWSPRDKHSSWVETVYELPEGTEIEVIGKGATGARGADKSDFHCIYRLDASVDVQDITIDVGLRNCPIKGRVVLVKDCLVLQEQAQSKAHTEGF